MTDAFITICSRIYLSIDDVMGDMKHEKSLKLILQGSSMIIVSCDLKLVLKLSMIYVI